MPILADISLSLPTCAQDQTLLFFLCGAISAVIFGLGKAGFGAGIGALSVPLMIFACAGDTLIATGMMLPLLIAGDYASIVAWWRQWDRAVLMRIVPASVGGIALGGLLLWRLGEFRLGSEVLMLLIGALSLVFVVWELLQWRRGKPWSFQPGLTATVFTGTALGVVSTLAHAAGPVAMIYLLSRDVPKKRFVATMVAIFWAVNQIKLIPFGLLGLVNTSTLWAGALLAPAVVAGAIAGKWLNRRIDQRQFKGIVYALLAVTALQLITQATINILWP